LTAGFSGLCAIPQAEDTAACVKQGIWACGTTFSETEESAISMIAHILLVDDNDIQAATRKAILARLGRGVIVASDGAHALEVLQAADAAHPIGLVITDHLMPGMNGPEFVTELRKSYPHLPVLVLSGMEDAVESYEDLDVVFRMKPLPPDDLLHLVRTLLSEAIGKTA
jgi:DNA-binding NtrC family response regulator